MLKMLRREKASSLRSASTASFPLERSMFPPPVSKESSRFEPPETGISEKLFPHTLWKVPSCFERKKPQFSKKLLRIHKQKKTDDSNPRKQENSKTFFSPYTLWKNPCRFERKKTEKQRKKALKVGCMRRYCHSEADFQGFFAFLKY